MISYFTHEMTETENDTFLEATAPKKGSKINPRNNYVSAKPMQHGVKSDYTTPLLLELFDKGYIESISKVLATAGLTIKETNGKRGFELVPIK